MDVTTSQDNEADDRSGESGKLDLSVVIPAFNEENGIGPGLDELHATLKELGLKYEVIVVDDGSTDRTAEEAAAHDCRVITNVENRGYGASLKRGFSQARCERVLITDADGTYPAEDIPGLLAVADDYDMVVGTRTGEKVHDSWARRPARSFLRRFASYLAGRKIPDLNSGLRLIKRSHVFAYARILPAGFSFTTTITLALLCTDHTVGYVPINYRRRVGRSKIRPSHAGRFLILILRVMVLFNPLKVFLPLGAACFLMGIAKLIYDLSVHNLSESAVMAFLAALIVWTVGLLADQQSRLGLERWVNPTPPSR